MLPIGSYPYRRKQNGVEVDEANIFAVAIVSRTSVGVAISYDATENSPEPSRVGSSASSGLGFFVAALRASSAILHLRPNDSGRIQESGLDP